jgi:hypothetical protein
MTHTPAFHFSPIFSLFDLPLLHKNRVNILLFTLIALSTTITTTIPFTLNMAPKKAPDYKSTNKHTVAELNYRNRKTGYELRIIKAKRSDNAAFNYAFKNLKRIAEWAVIISEDQLAKK